MSLVSWFLRRSVSVLFVLALLFGVLVGVRADSVGGHGGGFAVLAVMLLVGVYGVVALAGFVLAWFVDRYGKGIDVGFLVAVLGMAVLRWSGFSELFVPVAIVGVLTLFVAFYEGVSR